MANGTNGSSTTFALVMLGTVMCFVVGATIAAATDPQDAGLIIAAFLGGLGVTLPMIANFLTGLNTAKIAAQNTERLNTLHTAVDGVMHELNKAQIGEARATATLEEKGAQGEREAAAAAGMESQTTTTTRSVSTAPTIVIPLPAPSSGDTGDTGPDKQQQDTEAGK